VEISAADEPDVLVEDDLLKLLDESLARAGASKEPTGAIE
jgi:hypothetical protein